MNKYFHWFFPLIPYSTWSQRHDLS